MKNQILMKKCKHFTKKCQFAQEMQIFLEENEKQIDEEMLVCLRKCEILTKKCNLLTDLFYDNVDFGWHYHQTWIIFVPFAKIEKVFKKNGMFVRKIFRFVLVQQIARY